MVSGGRSRTWAVDRDRALLIRSDARLEHQHEAHLHVGRGEHQFGRDLVEAPYRVVLQRSEAAVTIVANGLGAFEVVD
jgi:hypothetical protein